MSEEITNTKEELYSKDLFLDEMSMIDNELNDLDNLYKEIKTHFDGIKNSQVRGSLVFLKDQTSNLISIKQAKLNYIKQRADMKKNLTEFSFKEKASNRQDSQVDEITEAIYKKISNEFKYNQEEQAMYNYQDHKDIEHELDEELDNIDIDTIVTNETSIEEIIVDYDSKDNDDEIMDKEHVEEIEEEPEVPSTIVVDMDTNLFYKIHSETFEILEELGSYEAIEDETNIDGDIYAIGKSGNIYPVIVIDEDE